MSHQQFAKLNRTLKNLEAVKIERWLITKDGVKRQYIVEFEKRLLTESKEQTAQIRMQNLKLFCLEFFLPRSPNPIAWQKDLQPFILWSTSK